MNGETGTNGIVILEVIHGSRAFGLNEPDSDTDLKGILVGPSEWYGGFLPSPEQIEVSKDHVRYDIRKCFRLASEANPTALELIWAPADCIRVCTKAGSRIIEARRSFLSRRVSDSFGNYAISQLKRIKTHRRWLLSPPKMEPVRSAFGLPERSVISNDQIGAADILSRRGDLSDEMMMPNFLLMLDRERSYRAARREWQQYHTWKQERNPKRAELEERYGYDTKHALHLVRLLRMSLEILTTGVVVVRRPDREELLAIKRGDWPFERLIEYAESMQARIKSARDGSILPEEPDRVALNTLCTDIVREVSHGC
ncbi:MAG TPA: nucleotidyltransferase domain-containing protein [Candidatus Ozemobacteraceae bacterium]|nr:nucleotidyltransferase domain-containing protein [Candidatus Ozemobacteraceae bacterium]